MIELQLGQSEGLQLLCIGAHCDDIEIGCGGTLLKWAKQYHIQKVKWIVFTSSTKRKAEALQSAAAFLEHFPEKEIEVLEYRDAFLPSQVIEVKEEFEKIRTSFQPDVIFTHFREDRHQDHRLLSDLTWNTFRSHLILEYEIPKYDGDLGQPNVFIELTPNQAQQKAKIILDSFQSQAQKHWFDEDTFFALMRLRAIESASQSKFAEAFYVRKLKL